MKKNLLIILPLVILFAGFACAFAVNNQLSKKNVSAETKGGIMDTDKKILIAYFSWGGNTKSVAEKIQKSTGGDMFRIETLIPYPKDYNETAYGVAKEQHDKGIKPELKENCDISNYDIIFVGTPAWWYTMAPAVMTFLSENNFEGKTIVPFITHGGGGEYSIAKEMGELSKASKVLKSFAVYEDGGADIQNKVDGWLKELK